MNNPTFRWLSAALLGGLCFVTIMVAATVGAHAQNGVPAQVLADLRSAAALAQQDKARVANLTAQVSDPLLAERMRQEGRRQSAATLGYVVNAAIAANPGAAQAIVSTAVSVAPDMRNDIVTSAITAYPGFRNIILATGSRAYSPPAARPLPVQQAARIDRPVSPALLPTPSKPAKREYSPPPPARDPTDPIWDPWEPLNRPLFAVFQVLDDFILRPVAASYGWITPDPIKEGVRNAFLNLNSPVVFANDVLQFDLSGAATTLGRFAINSTVGGLGFFDVAERAGYTRHPADFAQTLNRYHLPAGPYLVLPIFGPGTIRHHFGSVVDSASDPINWVSAVDSSVQVGLQLGEAVSMREDLIVPLDELREGSLDWYATFRAAYYQNRAVALRKGVVEPSDAENDLFDTFE